MKRFSSPVFESARQNLFQYMNAYCGLTTDDFNKLLGRCVFRTLEKKSFLIQPGEVDAYFNYIVEGVARKYIRRDNKEITLQLSTEGHFIHAEHSFHTGTPADCYVEAIEKTSFISIHKSEVESLFQEVPVLNKLARLILSELYIRKELRDLSLIRLSARERFLHYVQKHPDMLQRVSQKYIASYLNIKPETFSRLKHLTRLRK